MRQNSEICYSSSFHEDLWENDEQRVEQGKAAEKSMELKGGIGYR